MNQFLEQFRSAFSGEAWVFDSIASLVILLLAAVLYYVAFSLIRRYVVKTYPGLEKARYRAFRIPSLVLVFSLALSFIIAVFIPENIDTGVVRHILNLLIIISITWLLCSLLSLGRAIILIGYDLDQKDNLKARKVYTQLRLIERILIFLLIVIAIAIGLMTFEDIRNVGVGLFASAGVAAIILGFSAQKLIATVIAGFQIAISQPIRIDDVVIVENEWGRIEEINLTYVVVKIWDERRLILPTTYFIEKPFQNWTRTSADIMGTVFIYLDYTVPFDELRKELTRILESDTNWDGKVNVLQVTDATEKTVEVRALMSSPDSSAAWDLRVNVREQLIRFLQQNYPESLPKSRVELSNPK
ncbi:MAG: mechanosensitive ion channel domain-containing protein [Bacteroidota bacterium]